MKFRNILVLAIVITALGVVSFAYANNSWNGYHWARTANPFTLQLGDNVSGAWDAYLAGASSDWSQSSVLDTLIRKGKTNPRSCLPTSGRVEVCSARYGVNGWLGLTQVWVNGEHITQGTVKVNDSYLNSEHFPYNTPEWRSMVMCHEIGHTLGLDHQDEDFFNPNLGTCLDYAVDPTTNQHPNLHDYATLGEIYAHFDSFNSLPTPDLPRVNGKQVDLGSADLNQKSEWGKEVRRDQSGKHSEYERDLGRGQKLVTHVTWVE